MKKIIYFLEFILVYALFIVFKIIGYKGSSNLGFFIGKIFGPIFRSKSLIIKNLEKSKIVIKNNKYEIAKNVLGNYGRIFAEYPHLKNFRNNKLNKFIKIEGLEHLEKIKNNNKPVVFISGHFNNFELMAMQIEKSGINLAAIYRPLNNIFVNIIMERIRKNYICKNQIKKGQSGIRELLSLFHKGHSVALMIDQRLSEGIKSKFFGEEAYTTTIPAQFVKKFDCKIVPIYIERSDGINFKMKVFEPIKYDKNISTEKITLDLNSWLEKMILNNPGQWIWSHDRWK